MWLRCGIAPVHDRSSSIRSQTAMTGTRAKQFSLFLKSLAACGLICLIKYSRTREFKKNPQSRAEFRIAPFLASRILGFLNA
jgi:hypothetical protein